MLEKLNDITVILPVAISVSLAYFASMFWRNLKDRTLYKEALEISSYRFEESEPEVNTQIETLVLGGDIELRVLEEISQVKKERSYFRTSKQSIRVRRLRGIQSQLRIILRSHVGDKNFEEIKTRSISIIDESEEIIQNLLEREPFEELKDPEKSLLVDILEELPENKEIPRQKTFQLADIIKLKHQDIRKLQIENAKSATWTRWGVIGTIMFGILSLGLSIFAITT